MGEFAPGIYRPVHFPKSKPNDPKCSCVTGQYECWHCRKPKIERIVRNQTPKQQEYDRLALSGWRDDGCSCHINPPCSYCTSHCAECGEYVDECECSDGT